MAACPVTSSPPSRLWRRPIVVSRRRIEANRRNAAHSTGPRTEAGKARVARNAVRHGFFAAPHRWSPQYHRDFHATYDALRGDIRPRGIGEESCVWSLAHEYARMASVLRYESAAALEYHHQSEREFDARLASADKVEAARLRAQRERLRRAGLWGPTLPGPRALSGITRCIGSINQSIRRATVDLQGFQRFRDGQAPRTRRRSTKLREQTHLMQENRAISLMDLATKAHRELLQATRAVRSSGNIASAAPTTSNHASATLKNAKTNPLSSMFIGNRHERRRAAALARRRM